MTMKEENELGKGKKKVASENKANQSEKME